MHDLIVSLCSAHRSIGYIISTSRWTFSLQRPMQSSGTPLFSQHVSLNLKIPKRHYNKNVSISIFLKTINIVIINDNIYTWAILEFAFCVVSCFSITWFSTIKLSLRLMSSICLNSVPACFWTFSNYPISPCAIN